MVLLYCGDSHEAPIGDAAKCFKELIIDVCRPIPHALRPVVELSFFERAPLLFRYKREVACGEGRQVFVVIESRRARRGMPGSACN